MNYEDGKKMPTVEEVMKMPEEKIVEEICVTFGYALRHTVVNHHTKSEQGWRRLGQLLCGYAEQP